MPASDWAGRAGRLAVVVGASTLGGGLVVLVVGWWFGVEWVRVPLAGAHPMVANAAAGVALVGFGMLAAGLRWPRWITGAAGGLVAILGFATVVEYAVGSTWVGLDESLAIESVSSPELPGRMPINAALNLTVLGFALVLLAARRLPGVRQALAALAAAVAFGVLLGFVMYDVALSGLGATFWTQTSPVAALCVFSLGIAVVATDISVGWAAVFAEDTAGGRLARAIVPGFVGVALAAGVVVRVFRGSDILRAHSAQAAVMLVLIVGFVFDVVMARRATATEQSVAASEQQYRLLAENATDVVWQLDADGVLVWVSPSVAAELGWDPQQLLGTNVRGLIHPADLGATQRWKASILAGQHLPSLESRRLTADGGYKWMSLQARPITSADGSDTSLVVGMRDIDDEVRARTALETARAHDPLTGLPTMEAALDRLDRLLADLDRSPPELSVGVLCVGVDSLKAVNEALDHAAGDLVLQEVATRIATVVDDRELLARRPGDEFLVLLPDLASDADAIVAAEKIRLAVRGPLRVGSEVFALAVSIGIATGSADRRSSEIVRDAAVAMHEAKNMGRDRSELFQARLGQAAQHRLTMEQQIRDGLRDGQFVPWFQPIVALDGGAVVGYEALVRWVRADGSIVSPDDFLPVAEQSLLIVQLDLIILRRSVDVLSRLPAPMHVSLNVSAATLTQEDYARWVVRALQVYGVDPARLHLEITETALLTITDRVRHGMGGLAERGIGWYVDDFGTGYSSLAHLRELPIAGMKLDMSFTAAIEAGDQNAETLAAGMAALAANLGLATVAEGIETDNQAAILRAQGWKCGQGWLYGRGEPAAAIQGAAARVPNPRPRPGVVGPGRRPASADEPA